MWLSTTLIYLSKNIWATVWLINFNTSLTRTEDANKCPYSHCFPFITDTYPFNPKDQKWEITSVFTLLHWSFLCNNWNCAFAKPLPWFVHQRGIHMTLYELTVAWKMSFTSLSPLLKPWETLRLWEVWTSNQQLYPIHLNEVNTESNNNFTERTWELFWDGWYTCLAWILLS